MDFKEIEKVVDGAYRAYIGKNYHKSISLLEKVLREGNEYSIKYNLSGILLYLGACYSELNLPHKAYEYYKRAAECDNPRAEALEKYSEAEERFKQAKGITGIIDSALYYVKQGHDYFGGTLNKK